MSSVYTNLKPVSNEHAYAWNTHIIFRCDARGMMSTLRREPALSPLDVRLQLQECWTGYLRMDLRKIVSVTVSLFPTKFVLIGHARVTMGFWYSCRYDR